MARIQSAMCSHCGANTTVYGSDGSWLPKWSVCNDCKEGIRLAESYGDCDELLYMLEGNDALALRIRFRGIEPESAYKSAMDKAMQEQGVDLAGLDPLFPKPL